MRTPIVSSPAVAIVGTSGIEGLQDVRLVEAIYRSARDGRPVTLPRLARPEAVPASEADLRKPPLERRQAG